MDFTQLQQMLSFTEAKCYAIVHVQEKLASKCWYCCWWSGETRSKLIEKRVSYLNIIRKTDISKIGLAVEKLF